MRTQDAQFECKECGKVIDGQLLVDCSIPMFTKALKEIKCPNGCSWKQLVLLTSTVQYAK